MNKNKMNLGRDLLGFRSDINSLADTLFTKSERIAKVRKPFKIKKNV